MNEEDAPKLDLALLQQALLDDGAPLIPQRTLLELAKLGDRLQQREFALSSTINFAKLTGSNSWNFEKNEPCIDEHTGFCPWGDYAEEAANYLDAPCLNEKGKKIAKPIKPMFIARDHWKTTIAMQAAARFVLRKPNSLNGIISTNDPKAESRIRTIGDILKSPVIQDLFEDVLYPADGKARYHYTGTKVELKRKIQAPQGTIEARGMASSMAGLHFNGFVMVDDIVDELNYNSPDIQHSLWMKFQQIINFVCSPGCEVWLVGTRYSPYDAYMNILDDKSKYKKSIVPGKIITGCYTIREDGSWLAHNEFRFCDEEEEQENPVEFRGKTFHPLRESLKVKRDTMEPKSEWYAQMENNPQSEENAIFQAGDFKRIIPCKYNEIETFMRNKAMVLEYILHGMEPKDPNKFIRLPIKIAILGDIAYGTKKHSDWSTLLVVGQDVHDDFYLINGWRKRTGYKGLDDYFERALTWRDQYGVRLALGIEVHAKESSINVAIRVAAEIGVVPPRFHELKDNSYVNKLRRITASLEGRARSKRIHVMADFPKGIMEQLDIEGQHLGLAGGHDDIIDTFANARQVFPVKRVVVKKKSAPVMKSRILDRMRRRR